MRFPKECKSKKEQSRIISQKKKWLSKIFAKDIGNYDRHLNKVNFEVDPLKML